MALIKHIDAVFDRRQNITQRDRQTLTFDCLLNCIDGIERSDRRTVCRHHHEPARENRLGPWRPDERSGFEAAGRADRMLEMRLLDEAGRRKLASKILADWPGEWERLVTEGAGDSGAQFQERCSRRALKLHYCKPAPKAPASSKEQKEAELSATL